MKAKDITPGDYEVKTYRGLEQVNIVEVKDFTRQVYGTGDGFRGHSATTKMAFDAEGKAYPLTGVIRPWARAAAQHDEKEVRARRLAKAKSALATVLPAGLGRIEEGRDYQYKPNGTITIVLTATAAEELVDFLATKIEQA